MISSVFFPNRRTLNELAGPRSLSNFHLDEPHVPAAAVQFSFDSVSRFELLRRQIKSFANLPQGWDSYRARPLSAEAITNAFAVLEQMEECGIVPSRVAPTCDNSILLRYSQFGTRVEWEFFSDGESLRVAINDSGEENILEVPSSRIGRII